MSSYFSIGEMCHSNTALTKGIGNAPDEEVIKNLEKLIVNLLDPLRELWGAPIRVNSGYRCEALNRALGGAVNSQHLRGEAADITVGSRDSNRKLYELLQNSSLEFDQLIDEKGFSWIHVSYREGANRRQAFRL